ncbi:tryptophan--tRNA ligase [candidate division WOR-1 bacterium RIFCSPHIGHO2_01_FULL_53_15]|uniref:Tryptophan--tRNA ligase n=1 Tax=candidate division WOR-1 bacterium RIFCSPHIGHO2_01_FULL_53_15 TaxID=1802564 RepID=A0A1F4PZS1_UNCSA|nr:MAG: tryptophan--tRNA ligase [candidate division WOR-1 bacterium RIFCSPHIGHO2_01_FULL_53_15]OGC10664.1 MAG: tryptophan--tRNA ligase [candidate division WOR-1 bacterium RIFCSPHIGHO2_02_FULL_53_26]
MSKQRVLSGIQPTGRLHLGNLIGAVENWVELQQSHDCYFFIADYHALTTSYADTKNLADDIRQAAIDLLSAGVAPEKAVLFRQSDVPEHAELHLLLSMLTPLAWLERVPTYKSKIEELKERDLGTYGFLGYPVLQAADILIYKASRVPVGEDQLPHLELTREIARRFNYLYKEIFPEPQAALTRFPALPGTDGRKMSKSYRNTIAISDTPDAIRKKVGIMVTDPERIKREDIGHPDVCPVYQYYKIFARDRREKAAKECREASRGCVDCKKELAQVLIEYLAPIHAAGRELEQEPKLLDNILKNGAERARAVASATLTQAKKAIGLA